MRILYADDQDDEERRRRRRARALALLLFAPWKKLRPQIAMAAHAIDTYFSAVDLAMDTSTLSKALKSGDTLVSPLTRLVQVAMLGGFKDGGALVGKTPGSKYTDRALRQAGTRAREVSSQMHDTSLKWLKADPHNEFTLSSDRADRAAKFEAARGYYTGLQQSLWGEGFSKSWLTTSENPCEEICIPNEDQGPIPIEAEFPSGDYAPLAHLNCFAGSVAFLASGPSRVYRRRYHGKVIIFDVPGYGEEVCTPNHPILTRRGWISATQLKQGDDFVQCVDESAFERLAARIDPNDQQVKAAFEDYFSAAQMASHVRRSCVPSSAEEFHGDGVSDYEVDVVTVDGLLPNERHPLSFEEGREHFFITRLDSSSLVTFMSLSALSDFIGRAFSSSRRLVGSFYDVLALRFRQVCPSYFYGGALASNIQSEAFETVLENETRNAGSLSDTLDRLPVSMSDMEFFKLGVGKGASIRSWEMPIDLKFVLSEVSAKSCGRDTEMSGDTFDSLAACMRFVKLKKIFVIDGWEGQVYNLETRSGWYLANSIVAHNCECILEIHRPGEL